MWQLVGHTVVAPCTAHPRAVSGGYDHQMIYKIVKRQYNFICAKAGIYNDSDDDGVNDEDV